MKPIKWNAEKNEWLRKNRDITFNRIKYEIENEVNLLGVTPHPSEKHSHQFVAILNINNYVWIVPFVEENEYIFLKTAFKSRKLTKDFLGEN